jgi:hypothetical protein
LRDFILSFVLALAAAGCRSAQAPASDPAPALAAALAPDPAPPPDPESAPAPTPTPAPAPEPPAGFVRINPREGSWTIAELFDEIHRATGISIVYDASDATFTQAKITVCGTHTIARDDLFDWLQAVLSYRRLVLVPVGPKGVDGKQQWYVMPPRPWHGRPPFVEATEIDKYADRRDLLIVSRIPLSPCTDATRMREALASILTTTDGIGRIREIPGEHALVVGDFAPVVAQAVRLAAVLEKEFVVTTSSPEAAPR